MIIGIDPGHGGIDSGAIGQAGTRESDVTLAISLLLASVLGERGHSVVLTRTNDETVSLRRRAAALNDAGCDLILSIHINAFDDSKPNYISSWICGTGGQAEKLAHLMSPMLAAVTGWPDGGIRIANFYILRKTYAPAVLLELGFISNPEQEQQLYTVETHEKLVRAIVMGLEKYFPDE